MATITSDRYGKADVRMVKVIRHADRHDLVDLRVGISLRGDFGASYTDGDNTLVLPTDTMKNTVYARGREHALDSIESFAIDLARHFATSHDPVSAASVAIERRRWDRIDVDGAPHPHAFRLGGGERDTCLVTVEGDATTVCSGVVDLVILKTTDSGFSDFTRDRYTTLKDADDRILGTSLSATWHYAAECDWNAVRANARAALVETFATHKSLSVQHTLHEMGEVALRRCSEITRVDIAMPNKHCLLVDLSPFDLDNPNEIFVPVDEPSGQIEASVARSRPDIA